MANTGIYQDIATRTGGDIYIGVVGPVRTGKSTLIRRFMESLVIPNIENEHDKTRARDEMPQSAAGRTVMTTEPKFVPDEAVRIDLGEDTHLSVKMVDCVGYLVPDALGNDENGEIRMVRTPWSEEQMPFEEAAEMGTERVIREHATIGLVVTTDGTIGDIPRDNYAAAEERVVRELQAIGKPFAIILNSADPSGEAAAELAMALEEKYNAPVALVNCLDLDTDDIKNILELILLEFPVTEVELTLPSWTGALDRSHRLIRSITSSFAKLGAEVERTGDIPNAFSALAENEFIESIRVCSVDYGKGRACLEALLPQDLYYRTIGELTGLDIGGEDELLRTIRELSEVKRAYDKYEKAIAEVGEKGYGIVLPNVHDLTLEEPEVIKQSGGYGIRLRATAPSIHMIAADIETEIHPIVGTEAQSEELVRHMLSEMEEDPDRVWESNMFGKTLYELMSDGLQTKLAHIQPDARVKLSETLSRVINEGSGGLICIIL